MALWDLPCQPRAHTSLLCQGGRPWDGATAPPLQVSGASGGAGGGNQGSHVCLPIQPSKVVTENAQHLPLEMLGAGDLWSKLAKRC